MDKISCFISHTWRAGQHRLARYFANRLRRYHDLVPWIDEERIQISQDLHKRLEEGLREETDCCIVLLSPEYLEAENAPRELEMAAALCFEERKPLFVVVIRPVREYPMVVADKMRIDFSHAISPKRQTIIRERFDPLMSKLVQAIRSQFEYAPNVLSLFTPPVPGKVLLVTNRSYSGPYPEPSSTTVQFMKDMQGVLNVLGRRGLTTSCETRETDYVSPTAVSRMVSGSDHIVSYASSKINKCTESLLRKVEQQYGVTLRFVMEKDLRNGRRRSRLPDFSKNEHAALLWNDQAYYHDDALDHAIIVRARLPAESSRTCWILAGCGRSGSVAARQLVFEGGWDDQLWRSLGRGWKKRSFIALVSVAHDRPRHKLKALERLEIVWL